MLFEEGSCERLAMTADVAKHLEAKLLPPRDLVAYVRKVEREEAD